MKDTQPLEQKLHMLMEKRSRHFVRKEMTEWIEVHDEICEVIERIRSKVSQSLKSS